MPREREQAVLYEKRVRVKLVFDEVIEAVLKIAKEKLRVVESARMVALPEVVERTVLMAMMTRMAAAILGKMVTAVKRVGWKWVKVGFAGGPMC